MPEITASANFRLYLSVMMVSHCSHFFYSILSMIPAVTVKLFSNLPKSKSLKLHMCIILFLELRKIDDGDDGSLTPDF